jgi:hypothetical protein
MDGAHQVLSAARETPLDAVLPAGVLGANPFLKGKDVAYVQDWAERKMSGAAPKPTQNTTTTVAQTPAVPTVSADFTLFKQAIAEVLAPPAPEGEEPVEEQPETPQPAEDDTAMLEPDAGGGLRRF